MWCITAGRSIRWGIARSTGPHFAESCRRAARVKEGAVDPLAEQKVLATVVGGQTLSAVGR